MITRTVLQAEPVLGGKKLDLLRIYKTVMEAGGYEKVKLTNIQKEKNMIDLMRDSRLL